MGKYDEQYKKFGNNFFTLKTYVKGVEKVLKGVMLELPAFSYSTKWDKSPRAAISEELYKVVNKPEFEFLAAKGNGANVMRRTGLATSKVYENSDPVSFEIKFRCYTGQYFGNDDSLSTTVDWLNILKNTTISETAEINIDKVINLVKNAASNGIDEIFGIVDDIKGIIDSDDHEEMQSERKRKKKMKREGSFVERLYATMTMPSEREIDEATAKDVHKRNTKKDTVLTNKFGKLKIEDSKQQNKRVYNSSKNFGANLFYLRIYPFIFKEPLIIFISSWTISPSKEWNIDENKNFYVDFTLNCEMDQVPSAAKWQKYLVDDRPAWKRSDFK